MKLFEIDVVEVASAVYTVRAESSVDAVNRIYVQVWN